MLEHRGLHGSEQGNGLTGRGHLLGRQAAHAIEVERAGDDGAAILTRGAKTERRRGQTGQAYKNANEYDQRDHPFHVRGF